jgi:hypothetical protein
MGQTPISFTEEQRAKAVIQALSGSPGLGQIAQEVFNTGPVMGADGVRDFGDVVTLGQPRDIGDMFRIGTALGLVDDEMFGSDALGRFRIPKKALQVVKVAAFPPLLLVQGGKGKEVAQKFTKGIVSVAKVALPAVLVISGVGVVGLIAAPLVKPAIDAVSAKFAKDPKSARVAAEGVIAQRAIVQGGGETTPEERQKADIVERALLNIPGGGNKLARARGDLHQRAQRAGVGPTFAQITKPPPPRRGGFGRFFGR